MRLGSVQKLCNDYTDGEVGQITGKYKYKGKLNYRGWKGQKNGYVSITGFLDAALQSRFTDFFFGIHIFVMKY